MSVFSWLKHSFSLPKSNKDIAPMAYSVSLGTPATYDPSYRRFYPGNERSILASCLTKIAIDVASLKFRHVIVDRSTDTFIKYKKSPLDACLNVEANIDQDGFSFILDLASTILEEGHAVIVPTESDVDPSKGTSFDIYQARVGTVTTWFPRHVEVDIYNDVDSQHHKYILPKSSVAIITNPFYRIMNEPNSTLQRLKRKIAILDKIDEEVASNKFNLIIQLPYSTRNEIKKEQAESRTRHLEMQLSNSKYGIGYIDASERIVQLNRSIDNNLLEQVKDLKEEFYSQLGFSVAVFNGTASEQEQHTYNVKCIDTIATAIVSAMRKSFLTKTARSQGQDFMFFRNALKALTPSGMVTAADTYTRNQILSSNEIRANIGYLPREDEQANELSNKNLNAENRFVTDPEQEISNESAEPLTDETDGEGDYLL